NDTNIVDATNTMLTLTNLMENNSGNYTVVISNIGGSITSMVAALTVAVRPYFIVQPESQTVLAGDSVTFSVVVGGTPPLAYRWRKGSGILVNFGVGTNTLTRTNLQVSDSGNYNVVVTNI